MSSNCILIVEADILVRSPLATYLRECGYRVLEAGSPAQARDLLDQGSIPIDIVMVDVSGNDGACFELATSIRATNPGCDLILAGSPAKAVKKAGDLCEEGPAIAKPYDHSLVLDQIRRLLAKRGNVGSKEKN
jgi:DNA-binding response OmpR family regulator